MKKIKLLIALVITIITMNMVYIVRVADKELTMENILNPKYFIINIIFIIMILGASFVGGEFGDDD